MNNNQVDKPLLMKLLTIGNPGVGKTQLLSRYVDNCFCQSYVCTIGVEFKVKTIQVNQQQVKLQIWDTAGQERFRSLSAVWYRGAKGILIVFDLSDAHSFEGVQNWLDQINQNIQKDQMPAIILIGNKNDLEPQVATDNILQFANSNNLLYFEVSAKTGKGVDDAFDTLANEAYQLIQLQDKKQIVNKQEQLIEYNDKNQRKACCQ